MALAALRALIDAQKRLTALSIISGWQSFTAIAQWAQHKDPICPHYDQYDNREHGLLTCSQYSEVRQRHPRAVSILQDARRLICFPLPVRSPNTSLIKQAMFSRRRAEARLIQSIIYLQSTLYTDGSCDYPTDPIAARSAWSVILQSDSEEPQRTMH